MRISFTAHGKDDYEYWVRTDVAIARRITALLRDIQRDPFNGIGKPEPLRHSLAGWWSRRINREHRLVYTVSGEGSERTIVVAQARGHY